MKKLYTAADIENLVSSGQTALILNPGDILTPLARDQARELGLHLRSGQSGPPAPSPPPHASPLAIDALAAFRSLLQQARADVTDVPHLAKDFDDLLRATEHGEAIHPPSTPQRAGLSSARKQALAAHVEKMGALAQYLFGPGSSHRRYDILWALTTLKNVIGY